MHLTRHTTWTSTDFCQDGTPWRKRTAFLSTQLHHVAGRDLNYEAPGMPDSAIGGVYCTPFVRRSLMEAAMRKCDGHGTCSRSHRPHQILHGIQPSSGRFFTIVVERYPRGLCRRLVKVYIAAIAHKNEEHIYKHLFSGMCGSTHGLENRVNKLFSPRNVSGPCQFGSRVCFCVRQCA